MKRLTECNMASLNGHRCSFADFKDKREIYRKLATYEDTGLTPGEVMKLKDHLEDKKYEIIAIMSSVDKWLEGDELKENAATRAAIMREKTLQIIERLQDELNRYRKAKTKGWFAEFHYKPGDVARTIYKSKVTTATVIAIYIDQAGALLDLRVNVPNGHGTDILRDVDIVKIFPSLKAAEAALEGEA